MSVVFAVVDAIGSTDVLIDLNDGAPFTVALDEAFNPAFDLGFPEFDPRPNGSGIEATSRQVSFELAADGSSSDIASGLNALARVLVRDESILYYKPSDSLQGMWIRTYASPASALRFGNYFIVGDTQAHFRVPMTLTADPYVYGPREAFEVTLGGNPSSSTGVVSAAVNLCPLPSAETATVGWDSTGTSVSRSTSWAASGSVSWRLFDGADETVSQASGYRQAVTAGNVYSVRVRVQHSYAVTPAIRWYDVGGSLLSTTTGDTFTLTFPTSTFTWTTSALVEDATAPPSATHAGLSLTFGASETGFASPQYWDAVMFTESAASQGYADGDSSGWDWLGTPHESTSGPVDEVSTSDSVSVSLPEIKGDVPSPARLAISPSLDIYNADILVQVAAFESPGSDVLPLIVDLDSNPPDSVGFAAPTSAAGWIGTGYIDTTAAYARFGLPYELQARPGAYRVFLRCSNTASVTDSAWNVELKADAELLAYGPSLASANRVISAEAAGTNLTFVDMGIVDLPLGAGRADPTAGATATQVDPIFTRLSGSTNLRLDAFVFIPHDAPRIDGRVSTAIIKQRLTGSAGGIGGSVRLIADPDVDLSGSLWVQGDEGIVEGVPSMLGSFVDLHPGYDNILTALQNIGTQISTTEGAVTSTDLDETMTIEVSYYPRYVWLAQ